MKDEFGRNVDYLRISVTDLCNLRCRYCMPADGVEKKSHEDIMSVEDMIKLVEVGTELGIRKVRITGGEPLVKPGIISLCQKISEINAVEELCMTTNGTLLESKGKMLKEAGVGRLNISLDTLKEDRYSYMTRGGELSDTLRGIDKAISLDFEKIKINVVLIKGFNEDEIRDFVEFGMEKNVDVRFIELMEIGGANDFSKGRFIGGDEVFKAVPHLVKKDQVESVADIFGVEGSSIKVGLIRPVSSHFCRKCNKLRLTADGMLKPCLRTAEEIEVKNKSKIEMERLFKVAIGRKPGVDVLESMEPSGYSLSARSMNRIGG